VRLGGRWAAAGVLVGDDVIDEAPIDRLGDVLVGEALSEWLAPQAMLRAHRCAHFASGTDRHHRNE
jgi:hypothetical protein